MRSLFLALVVVLAAVAGCSRQEASKPGPMPPPTRLVAGQFDPGGGLVSLPVEVGAWRRPETPKRITADTIFDYMDGAGELYLAYRFDHLDVFEYKPADPSAGTILVEIYSMKTSDDAFGLLSNDWGGEVIEGVSSPGWPPAVPQRGARYGGGLLRMADGSRYVRILAARETATSRDAVLRIARGILTPPGPPGPGAAANRALPPSPPGAAEATRSLPRVGPPLLTYANCKGVEGLVIRPDRTCFFRSHLVLNSQYFLASEDILGLGLDVDAVTFEYGPAAPGSRPTRVVLVRYPSPERARAGGARFVAAYLPEADPKRPNVRTGSARTEHGWVAWGQKGQDLAIVFDAGSAAAARDLVGCTLAAAHAPGSASAD